MAGTYHYREDARTEWVVIKERFSHHNELINIGKIMKRRKIGSDWLNGLCGVKTKKISNNFISIFSPCRSQSETRADKQILSAPSVTKTLCQLGAMRPGEWDRLCDRLGCRICLFFLGETANELMEERVLRQVLSSQSTFMCIKEMSERELRPSCTYERNAISCQSDKQAHGRAN